jgi:hypothetical protein
MYVSQQRTAQQISLWQSPGQLHAFSVPLHTPSPQRGGGGGGGGGGCGVDVGMVGVHVPPLQ